VLLLIIRQGRIMQSTIHLIRQYILCQHVFFIYQCTFVIDGLVKPNGNLARHVPFNRVARYQIILNKRQYQTTLIIDTYSFPPHGLMISLDKVIQWRHFEKYGINDRIVLLGLVCVLSATMRFLLQSIDR